MFCTVQALFPLMRRGSAVLLMLSELADAMSASAFMGPYSMSKFALEVRFVQGMLATDSQGTAAPNTLITARKLRLNPALQHFRIVCCCCRSPQRPSECRCGRSWKLSVWMWWAYTPVP